MAAHITDWVVEACTAPGKRGPVWLGTAGGPGEAMRKAKAIPDQEWTWFYVKPNYVATPRSVRETKDGLIWPELWEDQFDWKTAP